MCSNAAWWYTHKNLGVVCYDNNKIQLLQCWLMRLKPKQCVILNKSNKWNDIRKWKFIETVSSTLGSSIHPMNRTKKNWNASKRDRKTFHILWTRSEAKKEGKKLCYTYNEKKKLMQQKQKHRKSKPMREYSITNTSDALRVLSNAFEFHSIGNTHANADKWNTHTFKQAFTKQNEIPSTMQCTRRLKRIHQSV